ncbi:hypothetical protein Adt_31873 [Abeliophyllum distichum]|uniref:Uncharacterized protein n=1 Tax=Abeliophyllum distichum TaxID=126358 RepID=A0ABD1RGS8_9LAMI
MEYSSAQGPLPLGLGHLPACSAQGMQLHSRSSPTGTRPPNSSLRPRSTDSFKGLFHWDSGHLPTCSAQGALLRSRTSPTRTRPPTNLLAHEAQLCSRVSPLGLDHLTAHSAQGAQLRSRASPTTTWPLSSLLCPRSTTSLKRLSH